MTESAKMTAGLGMGRLLASVAPSSGCAFCSEGRRDQRWFQPAAEPEGAELTWLDKHITEWSCIQDVDTSFAIVAEPNRRAILSLLLSSERCVGEIERELRLSQPSVSKHLRVLREAGFV